MKLLQSEPLPEDSILFAPPTGCWESSSWFFYYPAKSWRDTACLAGPPGCRRCIAAQRAVLVLWICSPQKPPVCSPPSSYL